MVVKLKKVIFFSKFFFLILVFSFIFFFFILNLSSFYRLSFDYFHLNGSFANNYSFNFLFDFFDLIFLFMLFVVTILVTLYREVYMEFYNNKKFIFLIFLFFLSIIVLRLSRSLIMLMLGWDGLGVSSICLIMFYPNKLTNFNSILTIFFNRLGDVILIVILLLFMMNFSIFYFFLDRLNLFFFFLVFICSFTKSAQFPLSSWLPAAISAPTPISSIVHSSTLVTAGIFFIRKFIKFFELNYLIEFLLVVRSLTFLLGGLIRNLELDLKKIVAFSTISQIRLILFFCSLSFVYIAITHIVFHAFFKTILFCCSGLIFLFNFRSQNFLVISSFFNIKVLNCIFFFRVYRMRGLIFSSSFFRKDLILEILFEFSYFNIFILLMLGRIFTIYYGRKIINSTFSWFNSIVCFQRKDFIFLFFVIFSFIILYFRKLIKYFIFLNSFPLIFKIDIFIMIFFLLIPFFIYLKFNFLKLFFLPIEVFFIKNYTYWFYRKILNFKFFSYLIYRDNLFFKKEYLNLMEKFYVKIKFWNFENFYLLRNYKNFYLLFFFSSLFFFFFIILIVYKEHDFEDVGEKE